MCDGLNSYSKNLWDKHNIKYFWNGYFGYVSAPNMDTDRLMVGLGKMFTFHKGVYVDPSQK